MVGLRLALHKNMSSQFHYNPGKYIDNYNYYNRHKDRHNFVFHNFDTVEGIILGAHLIHLDIHNIGSLGYNFAPDDQFAGNVHKHNYKSRLNR